MIPLPSSVATYINDILPTMHGWCSPAKAELLARSVLTRKPSVCVEIGVYAGRSLFAVATALRELTTGYVVGIDPWSAAASVEGFEDDPANHDWWSKLPHDMIYQQCCEVRARLQVEPSSTLFVGRSSQALPFFDLIVNRYTHGPFIDLLHIDGNHSKQQALYDVLNYVPLVRPGGEVWFDDLLWASTSDAQLELRKLTTMKGEVDGCGWFERKADVMPLPVA